jgi:DNA-binding ferritin-like protein
MTCHPTFPHAEENQGIMGKPVNIVKKHVAKTPPQEHPKERTHRDKIRHLIRTQIGISTLCKMLIKQDADDEAG